MPTRYLECIKKIAATLVRDAVLTRDGLTWESDDLIGADEATCSVVHGPVGASLYSGNAGIAWFLAHAARYDDSGDAAATALRAMRPVLARTRANLESTDLSLMSGATGVAWAAWGIGERLKRTDLRRSAAALARDIAALVRQRVSSESPDSQPLDLISGLAGIVVGLLAIHRRSPDRSVLEASHAACDYIIRRGQYDWHGLSWPERSSRGTHACAGPGLCGLGHGASGMALALAETAFASGDKRLLASLNETLRYERSWFSTDHGGWPDLRSGEPCPMTAWCHGALGIGLARLRLYEETRDTQALADIGAAINAARTVAMDAAVGLQHGRASDVTLCHGLAGAAELLLVAHDVLGEEEHLRAARRVGDLCIGIYEANGRRWPCGLRKCGALPGLFLGTAGIGTTLIRLHDARACDTVALPGYSARLRQDVVRQASASA